MHDPAHDVARIKELVAELQAQMEVLRLIDRLSDLYRSPIEQQQLYPVARLLATMVTAFAFEPLIEIGLLIERLEEAIAHD
jgi:hypothetical protein